MNISIALNFETYSQNTGDMSQSQIS